MEPLHGPTVTYRGRPVLFAGMDNGVNGTGGSHHGHQGGTGGGRFEPITADEWNELSVLLDDQKYETMLKSELLQMMQEGRDQDQMLLFVQKLYTLCNLYYDNQEQKCAKTAADIVTKWVNKKYRGSREAKEAIIRYIGWWKNDKMKPNEEKQ